MMINLKKQSGMTLLEVVVVVGLFSALILATTRVFVRTTDVQQRTVTEHDLQADLKYGLGVLLYEAEKDIGLCTNPGTCTCGTCSDLLNKYYTTNASKDTLCFFNASGLCVQYFLGSQTIMVKRGVVEETLTSSKIQINDLKFVVNEPSNDSFTVTAKAERQDKYDHELVIQTSITATDYSN